MSDREAILAGIVDEPSSRVASLAVFRPSEGDPWSHFRSQLVALGGRMIDEEEFRACQTRPYWADPALHLNNTAETVWDADVGISVAWRAVAQSGTLVLLTGGAETYRLSSLVPPTNVVVVNRNAIVSTLEHALADLPPINVVLVTGPSRTADIEGVLVRGVHGPGELLVWVREG